MENYIQIDRDLGNQSPGFSPLQSPNQSLLISDNKQLIQRNSGKVLSFRSHPLVGSEKAIKIEMKTLKEPAEEDADFFSSVADECKTNPKEEEDKHKISKEEVLVEENKHEALHSQKAGRGSQETLSESGQEKTYQKSRDTKNRFSVFRKNNDKIKRLNTKFIDLDNHKAFKVNLTFWEFICSLFKRKGAAAQKVNLIKAGISKIDERLDIFNILKKLREIDKLKALILEEDHRDLFNGLPKPEITLFDKKKINQLETRRTQYQLLKGSTFVEDVPAKPEIIRSYEEIMSKVNKTKTERKLIEIYDEIFSLRNSAQTMSGQPRLA